MGYNVDDIATLRGASQEDMATLAAVCNGQQTVATGTDFITHASKLWGMNFYAHSLPPPLDARARRQGKEPETS